MGVGMPGQRRFRQHGGGRCGGDVPTGDIWSLWAYRVRVGLASVAPMSWRTPSALERLNRALDLPMAVLSLVMVGIIVLQLVGDLAPPFDRWAEWLSVGIWSLFAAEFLVKLWVCPDRRTYVMENWLDVLILVLPVLRGLRVLRILRLSRGYQGLRFVSWLLRSSREVHDVVRQANLGYLFGTSTVVAVAAALMVPWLEADVPGARIRSFGEGLWWSATLITTINVGADPVTLPGRLIGFVLRIYGLSVFVYLVSTLTSYWFGQPQGGAPETAADDDRPAA